MNDKRRPNMNKEDNIFNSTEYIGTLFSDISDSQINDLTHELISAGNPMLIPCGISLKKSWVL